MEISPSIVCNNKSETTDLDYGEKRIFLRSNLKFCYLEIRFGMSAMPCDKAQF